MKSANSPSDILLGRFGESIVFPGGEIHVAVEDSGSEKSSTYKVYSTYLDVGSISPVVLIALAKNGPKEPTTLNEINWESLHVRSYKSQSDMKTAGVSVLTNSPQRPKVGSLHQFEDLKIEAVAETEKSKTYIFPSNPGYKLTLHTEKPVVKISGTELPRRTTFIPWVAQYNFVLEKL